MAETEFGYAELGLEQKAGEWSLHARVSEQALNIVHLRRHHYMPVDTSLFPYDTEYSIKLLGQGTIDAEDKEKAATLVDYVDAISDCMSYYDLQTHKTVANGRLHSLSLSSERVGDGVRLGMGAFIKRPENVSDFEISTVATNAMRSVALAIGYANPGKELSKRKHNALINDLVWTSYVREHGVTITTNPIGSCSLDTDGNSYSPDSDLIELHQHNLYTHSQQLLCLVGLVAIANAETLVK